MSPLRNLYFISLCHNWLDLRFRDMEAWSANQDSVRSRRRRGERMPRGWGSRRFIYVCGVSWGDSVVWYTIFGRVGDNLEEKG